MYANKICFNTKPITWIQIMKHLLSVYPMHLKCMVIIKRKYYYNGKIANGGMEYVKKLLDIGGESAYLDCIDDEEW